jgi:phosphatidate phosphatase
MAEVEDSYHSTTCKDVLAKGTLEVFGLVILILPMAYIYVFAHPFDPFHRGFFCDDVNLKHPYSEQTVPIVQCIIIWAVFSVVLIILVEILRSWADRDVRAAQGRSKPIPGHGTPWIAVELYRHFGYFTLGALTTLLFTEMAKYTVGRLRPHYLTLCQPDYSKPGLCKDPWDYQRFVTENEVDICLGLEVNGGKVTAKMLHEARLSFLSGHSSFSFYCATFLIVYLQARLSNFPHTDNTVVRTLYRILKVLRPFVQFGMITLAFWISLTRISNYFHHPYDVVTGAFVGTVFATITLLVIADLFNKRSSFWRSQNRRVSRSCPDNLHLESINPEDNGLRSQRSRSTTTAVRTSTAGTPSFNNKTKTRQKT